MRNVGLWRNRALFVFISGTIVAPAAFLLPEMLAGDTAKAMLLGYGVTAIIFGGLFAWIWHRDQRAMAALDRGEEILGHWHIDAESWRQFKLLNDEIHRQPGVLLNELSLRDEIPTDGIEIIVGKTAIQIDGSIHRLPVHGTPEVTSSLLHDGGNGLSYIELLLYYPGGGQGASGVPHSPTRTALRFPVPGTAWREARKISAHFCGLLPGKPDFFHGRGDGSDPEDLSRCGLCGYETHQFKSRCPQCGAGLQSRRWSRRFGLGLVVCGLFLSGLMGAVCYYTLPMLLYPGVEIGGTRFSGSPAQALMVLGILMLVMAFSLTTLLYGLWQMKTGKSSRRVAYFMLGIFVFLLLLAKLIEMRGM